MQNGKCNTTQYRKLRGYRIPGSRVYIPSAPKARQLLNPILTDPPLCASPAVGEPPCLSCCNQGRYRGGTEADRSRLDSKTCLVLLLAPRVYVPLNLGFGSLSTSCIVDCRNGVAFAVLHLLACCACQAIRCLCVWRRSQCLATLNSVWRRSTVFGDAQQCLVAFVCPLLPTIMGHAADPGPRPVSW